MASDTSQLSPALYIVATPIGNLEDITLRALRILKQVDVIACEDTRQTRKLLDHFGITTSTLSCHEHNETARAEEFARRMADGERIALVTDAGTPLVSDPGYRLVAAALAAGITVVPIPGVTAAMTALSAAGLPTDAFRFCGFLSPKSGARRKELEALQVESCTLVFYEAPHRILETLEDVEAVYGARQVVVARELTKLHEEFLRGTASEIRAVLAARTAVKGEITLLIGKGERVVDDTPLPDAVAQLEAAGVSRMDAIKQVARERGLAKRDVYRELT
jgi:16S rRNA (cytidine1402-2'-O)-methyltransferase